MGKKRLHQFIHHINTEKDLGTPRSFSVLDSVNVIFMIFEQKIITIRKYLRVPTVEQGPPTLNYSVNDNLPPTSTGCLQLSRYPYYSVHTREGSQLFYFRF